MHIRKSAFLIIVIFVITLLLITPSSVLAAPIENFPIIVTQPDGEEVQLFASGDDYYNWLLDANGYTVIQDPYTGYYVYADLIEGELVPTSLIAGRADPASEGLNPGLNISAEKRSEIRQQFLQQTENAVGATSKSDAPSTGTITNLVIYIRFADEGPSIFTKSTSDYSDMLNSSTAGANSLYNYYREVSYNALSINSTLLPTPGATVVSYQDSNARSYFQPYNAITNTIGYTGEAMRAQREHTLLRDAINYINGLGQFPSGTTIDADFDGYVDSITFVVSGSSTGWSSLLWPHQWFLFTYNVQINGKYVSEYAFQLEDMIHTGVLAHEMFHVLGAPDLYHYNSDGMQPVGGWDVMEIDSDPPQHMSCYMKYRYGGWINNIPQISSGTYVLNPLTSSINNCYKIASPYSTSEYFLVEYRRQSSSTFENSLPDSGLLVYRINTSVEGWGNSDGPPDEVYIYRPNGTISTNGSINTAHFSSDVGRTSINDSTNPSSFLSNGNAGGLNLCDVGSASSTISFHIGNCEPDGYEPDNTSGSAQWIYSGTPQNHNIRPSSDIDWVKFTVPTDSAILLQTSGITNSDTRMWLYNSSLGEIEYDDDDGSNLYSRIDRMCNVDSLPAGTYYIKIDSFANASTISNYTLSFKSSPCPSASIDVRIANNWQGSYLLAPSGSQRVNYLGVDSGPVVVESLSGNEIIAAMRDAYFVGGQLESFVQMMGLPQESLSTKYYFPAYNNVTLDGQLRFGNVGNSATTVTVTIGGVVRGTYPLNPGEAKRVNYTGLDSGPVVVESSGGVPIIAALRDAYYVNGRLESFAQLMGLPAEKLSTKYYFPAYNNVTLDGQLRVGNVGNSATTVTVTIAGVVRGTYPLNPSQAVRINYPSLDSGPVVVESSGGVPIIAAMRDAYFVSGKLVSFVQLMGLPAEQLSTNYNFPAYNNVTLDGQLRFGNIGNSATTVTVTIGGVVRGTYPLNPSEAKRVNYVGLDAGPVVIQSSGGVPIIAALRDAYFVNGVIESFAQMMGLPLEQLSSAYYFPAYNNVTLDEQLRFGVP